MPISVTGRVESSNRSFYNEILDTRLPRRIVSAVKGKLLLPIVLMTVLALSRWPELMPPSFSAVYAVAFCAGIFLTGRMAWWLPLGTLILSDLALNLYYESKGFPCFTLPMLLYMAGNYFGYIGLILFGKQFARKSSFFSLLGGGILGALAFYLVTNTLSWLINPFNNPEYSKTLGGWIWALTKGTGGWPETWTFFRNTLLSGGLFTGLFVAAMKLFSEPEEAEEKEEAEEEPTEPAESEPAAAK